MNGLGVLEIGNCKSVYVFFVRGWDAVREYRNEVGSEENLVFIFEIFKKFGFVLERGIFWFFFVRGLIVWFFKGLVVRGGFFVLICLDVFCCF